MAPFQALFLAPCSHCFHYKCVTTLLGVGFMFQCPTCRQVANLEASVTDPDDLDRSKIEEMDEDESLDGNEMEEDYSDGSPEMVVETGITLARPATTLSPIASVDVAAGTSAPMNIPGQVGPTRALSAEGNGSPSTPLNFSHITANVGTIQPIQAERSLGNLDESLAKIIAAATSGNQAAVETAIGSYAEKMKQILENMLEGQDPNLQNNILSKLIGSGEQ
jgi:hypothetical protein